MIRLLRVAARALLWLGRFRPLWGLVAFGWLLDSAVTTATDAAWFAFLGRLELWEHQLAWQIGVFCAFGVLALGASVFVMRRVVRPVDENIVEPPLPRALSELASVRARASRWGWAALLLGVLVIGRRLGASWPDFALSVARGGSWNNRSADFWVWHAPALAAVLNALWWFACLLGLVALVAGGLKALPFLAARQSITPRRWLRLLALLGGALLVLRSLGFVMQGARAFADVATGSDWGRGAEAAFCALGMLGCLACALALRRPRPIVVAWAGLFVLALPLVTGIFSSGQASVASSDARAKRQDEPVVSRRKVGQIPLWDEAVLKRVLSARLAWRGQRLVEWKSVGLSERANRAEVVGEEPLADAWAGHGMADARGALVWQSLDLPSLSPSRSGRPLGPLFYGLNARPLLSEEPGVGVPLGSWAWKAAWAWRLRDPLLLIESARAKRLLVWRGARETGERLAPFWTWDEAIPRLDPRTGSASFQAVAYASTSGLPRSPMWTSGPFAGRNAVRPVAILSMDARSGRVQIAPFPASSGTTNRFGARWASALPGFFGASRNTPVPAPLLETTRSGGLPLVWMPVESGWQKRAVPVELRGAVGQKLQVFERLALARTGSVNEALEGASPSLWREDNVWMLARPFFALSPNARPASETVSTRTNREDLKGVAEGPLASSSTGWGQTLALARADQATPSGAQQEPVSGSEPDVRATPSPRIAVNPNSTARDAARQAMVAQDAGIRALRAGRYVESEQQFRRAQQLLEPLTRP